jgi:hypothetical protein
MKKIKTLLSVITVLIASTLSAQVGIGNNDPKGALDITSTTDGLLIPRIALTNTTTVTVVTPMASEIVYNTATINDVTPGFYYLLTAAGPWVRFGGTGWLTNGNTDIINGVSFMGTINDVDVPFRRFNAPAGKLSITSTSFGVGALNSTSAGNNVAFGNNALGATTGPENVAIGFNALPVNVGGTGNVAIGYQSLLANTNSLRNTAIGWRAMALMNSAAATDNVAIGWQAMQDVPAGTAVTYGTFIGAQAGRKTTGTNSTGIGRQALGSNNGGTSSGIDNTAVGHQALSFNTTGQQNTAIGAESLYRVTTGRENTAIGYRSGGALVGGNQNTLLGYFAGNAITSGTNNIAIGYSAQVPVATNSNQIRIGNSIISSAEIQVAWTITSDRRYKSNISDSALGLDFIKTIRPVSYSRINDENNKTEYGFIAQEIETALIEAGDPNNGIILKDDAGMYGVRYNDFIPMTVKAVQEQQVLIEKLQKDNEELKSVNAAILKRLAALENRE